MTGLGSSLGRPFADRRDAGRRLASLLLRHAGSPCVVLGVPRGGVPVAAEVAAALGAPLDVVVARKLGAPFQPELGFGAVTHDGIRVLNGPLVRSLGLAAGDVEDVAARETSEVARRTARFREGRPPADVRGRTAILVDDGVATGYTVLAALRWLRTQGPARLVLAVPVVTREAAAALRSECDELVAVEMPAWLDAVGAAYADFSQTSDEEVVRLLARGRAAPADSEPRPVTLEAEGVRLDGDLAVPGTARGLVLFAHGSGSSRRSPRNRQVARALQRSGFATLLLDLLTPEEEEEDEATARLRFDVPLLARRLVAAVDWAASEESLAPLPVGLFGASTGAAAALVAAAARPGRVGAVVSRGGRPDLAGADDLARVRAPTLLLVGGADAQVLALNRRAGAALGGLATLYVVPGATHLFPEPGALEEVAREAASWFLRHLGRPAGGGTR